MRLAANSSPLALTAATAAALSLAFASVPGCEEGGGRSGGEASAAGGGARAAGGAAPATEPVRTHGVTEDGEEIVFAGRPRTSTPAAGPAVGRVARRAIDRDRLILEPTSPDPEGGDFTLEEAVVGLPIDGDLVAEIVTEFGAILCDLYADRAPRAVASFIGLARARRPFWDVAGGAWVSRPYYTGLSFFRVIPGYLVQAGDVLEDGTGTVGFTVPLERHETLSHDRAGRLALATRDGDPDSGAAQFYITDGPNQALDGTATIFGQCRPEDIIAQIARVVQSGEPDNRPLTPLTITRVFIRRVEGGAAAAEPTRPRLPEGEPEVGRAASPGPSELRERLERALEERELRRGVGAHPEPRTLPE